MTTGHAEPSVIQPGDGVEATPLKSYPRLQLLQRIRSFRRTCWQLSSLLRCGLSGYKVAADVILQKKALQKKWELVALMALVNRLRPSVVVEIGTYQGGTLLCWSRICPPTSQFISIDLPGGDFGGGYSAQQEHGFHQFMQPAQQLYCLRRDSHSSETLHELKSTLGDRSVDFLFIDGDHSYEGVRLDYEMYSPLVRIGGLIAFHDILPHPVHASCRVHEFWSELKCKVRVKELIDGATWGGIGVVFK